MEASAGELLGGMAPVCVFMDWTGRSCAKPMTAQARFTFGSDYVQLGERKLPGQYRLPRAAATAPGTIAEGKEGKERLT